LAAGAAQGDDVVGVAARPGVLSLRTGDVDTAATPNLLHDAAFGAGMHVVVLDGPMDEGRRAALRAAGVWLQGYLPTNGFIADLGGVDPAALRGLGFVTWVGAYQTAWKLDEGLRLPPDPATYVDAERVALAKLDLCLVHVWLFAGADAGVARAGVAGVAGAWVQSDELVGGSRCIVAVVPSVRLGEVTALPGVQFVEGVPEYAARSNSTMRWVVQSNQSGVTPLYAHGLTGGGQIMGVIDGWVSPDHCSFLDSVNPIGPLHRKILAYNATPAYDLHGTHVAGTALGDGGNEGNTRGVAYGARMVFNTWPNANEASVYSRFGLHAAQGARVHTNSWGTDSTRAYEGGCRAIDAIQHDDEDNLIIFAVSDSSLVTNPENAKNSLAVTASNNSPTQGDWCLGGMGPTLDGRRKPEIAAPGCAINSSAGASGCGTASLTGTSMACPAVAGVATLTRDYFMSGFYPSGVAVSSDAFTPSGQLIKAVLVNSAVDMAGVAGFPSNREGWGRVLADNALYFAGDSSRLVMRDARNTSWGALQTGGSSRLRLAVSSAALPFKVTLAWCDQPAQINASVAPVNNLDLRLISPSGVEYRGNNFAAGVSAPGTAADALNNLEQTLIVAPETGVWAVEVWGTAVQQGPQGYALAITGGVAEVACRTDYNQDGNADQDDLVALIQDIAAGTTSYPPNSPDVNDDGNVDQNDVAELIDLLASGGC